MRARTAGRRGALAVLMTVGMMGCRDSIVETPLTLPFDGPESADAALAVDPANGDLLLSWVGGDSTGWALYFARSGDAGTTWSAPSLVAAGKGEIQPQGESSPRLVAALRNRVALTWTKSVEVPGRKWPATIIRFARSLDGGINWSDAQTLNDDTTGSPAGHQFHGAAWSGDSGIVVAWLDERQGAALALHQGHESTAGDSTDEADASIYLASSSDFGETWKPNVAYWDQVCPCCRVSLARTPDGGVISAWRKHYPGNIRDVVTASLDSAGPGEPVKVHGDGWVYPGCPHTGPGVTIGSDGARHLVWYVGKEGNAGVFYRKIVPGLDSVSDPVPLVRSRTLPTAHTTVSAIPGGGAIAAYDIRDSGDRAIGISGIGSAGAQVFHRTLAGSTGGTYPQVAVLGPESAAVAWTSSDGGKRSTRLVRVRFPAVRSASK